MSDVVLSSALRTNLLSLQGTQSNIDTIQRALSTGLKVNSALDNPQSFFASQSLNNRANDLGRLLDTIGQSLSTIQTADKGISSLTKLVEQADSIATQARDAVTSGGTEAKVVGGADISQATNLVDINGIATNDQINITLTDPSDSDVNVFDEAGANGSNDGTVQIAATDSAAELVTKINDLNSGLTSAVIEAKLNDSGQLEIRSLNGGDLRIDFESNGGSDAENLGLASALGFGNEAKLVADGTANNNVEFTQSASASLTSFAFHEADGSIAEASDTLDTLQNSEGTALFSGLDNAADTISISVNDATQVSITLNNQTIQGFVDAINTNTNLNSLIKAEFDDTTGQISIRAISADAESVEFEVASDGNNNTQADFGFGAYESTGANTNFANVGAGTLKESIRFGAAAGELAGLEKDFNDIRTQIDQLVADSSYRGTNLLNGDDLETFFNEDRTSSLTTKGATFTAAGLGIKEADFGRASTVSTTLDEIRDGIKEIRSFGSSLANSLSVIQTRETFTKDLINELEAGSDKLVVADPNEEGAKLLALQTRQQLGVTALSLASQSQQSVLRLF